LLGETPSSPLCLRRPLRGTLPPAAPAAGFFFFSPRFARLLGPTVGLGGRVVDIVRVTPASEFAPGTVHFTKFSPALTFLDQSDEILIDQSTSTNLPTLALGGQVTVICYARTSLRNYTSLADWILLERKLNPINVLPLG
jgi:hypothetical protein